MRRTSGWRAFRGCIRCTCFTLLVSIPFLIIEWHARSHRHFWEGAILTPLLLQGCFPHLATFWNTVTWTLSCDVLLYLAFPYLLRLHWPRKIWMLVVLLLCLWLLGMVPHTIYVLRDPDHFGRMATASTTACGSTC